MELNLNDLGTLFGIILGTSAFVLSIVNHRRDTAKVTVEIQWDMSMTNNTVYDSTKSYAVITVANVGRRPVYLSHVAFRIPKGYETTHLLIPESIEGKKLAEGDSPLRFPLDQSSLEPYANKWAKIRAEVADSTGKIWKSKKPKKSKTPSWAK
ncbi:hypothetical protein [Pontiella sulfatireligans]|uniref:Uncharacterized protein n=1 Tax=Pontiella sulfatireligans TaxID=2750658 RepID=A0A6C2UNW8_9BACT|nr:hypothetical protein [Pontiella sulfatireligans]VGO21643.1 hypothetical protein SCARR_03717 [Pontiella sulfatireligans]